MAPDQAVEMELPDHLNLIKDLLLAWFQWRRSRQFISRKVLFAKKVQKVLQLCAIKLDHGAQLAILTCEMQVMVF